MTKLIILTNKCITWVFYFTLPIFLLILMDHHDPDLLRTILTCGISFIAVSGFRHFYNAPRPYEISGVAPRIEQKGSGHSFPSRHVFSAFIIAVSVLHFNFPCGIVLLFLGVILAFLRVALKVHYVKDVIVGAICGIIGGIIGFWLIP